MEWTKGRVYRLQTLTATLSAPVRVARRKGYLWFPTLTRTPGGDVLATMTNYPDAAVRTSTSWNTWSGDGGLTWSAPVEARYCDVHVALPSGDMVGLPYYLYPHPVGMAAPCTVIPAGTRDIVERDPGITVTGWPRPDESVRETGACGFVVNGQAVTLRDGRFLATLYGTYAGAKRYTLVTAVSDNGFEWRVLSTIADEHCALAGPEGPCEAGLCHLADGRLMCVYRLGAGLPLGQSFSSDDGETWSTPRAMTNAFSVQPSLAVLPGGTVVLSSGRPMPYVWFDIEGKGETWERVNLAEHHNAFHPGDAIHLPNQSSCYTEVIALDHQRLLCVYDRIPFGWAPVPEDSNETNSIWAVQIQITS